MVASALGSDGKTFTCVNLSLSIAREHDWSVVLVDGDSVKPHLTRLFGADKEPGLMDLLRDPSTAFDSYVMPTSIPGLAILPAGARDKHASELLVSARMASLCAEISAANPRRIVLFDSAPLLLTSEAPALATQIGQVVLVVRANRTPQRSVLEARDKIDPAKAINLVLNDAASRDGHLAYGYGYQGYPE
jgi:Mrp family chromosome partitioning ATPase